MEAGAPVARFDFANGALRGTHLALYPGCLVHRGDFHMETVPLPGIAAVRVEFERDQRRIGWGLVLLLVALALLVLAAPLGGLASSAADEMAAAGGQGVARTLASVFRVLEAFCALLPAIAAAVAIAACALGALGWIGMTVLTLTLAGTERAYPVRGRNTALLEFSEVICDRLAASTRSP